MGTPDFSVLHIEDDPLWASLVASNLRGAPGIRACWQAATAAEGLALARQHQPDLVVLDLNLPDARGTDLASDLILQLHPPRILLLTVRHDALTLHLAGQTSISGLLWKESHLPALLPAVRAVAAGQHYFPSEVQSAMRELR